MTVTLSFVCCINLLIKYSQYLQNCCSFAFTHSCHKLRMSTFNKDQWCYWWWRRLFKVNPSTVTYLIWKTVNNFDGNDDVVLLDCFSGTPYNEKSPRPSISSPLVKPSLYSYHLLKANAVVSSAMRLSWVGDHLCHQKSLVNVFTLLRQSYRTHCNS